MKRCESHNIRFADATAAINNNYESQFNQFRFQFRFDNYSILVIFANWNGSVRYSSIFRHAEIRYGGMCARDGKTNIYNFNH